MRVITVILNIFVGIFETRHILAGTDSLRLICMLHLNVIFNKVFIKNRDPSK